MKNFPSVFNFATIVNEMKVYSAFFDEKTNVDFSTGDVLNRVWSYRWAENSFLANKTIFMYNSFKNVINILIENTKCTDYNKNVLTIVYRPVTHEITGGMNLKRNVKKNLEDGCIFIPISNKDFKNFTEFKYFHLVNEIKMMIRLHNVQEDF